MKRLSPEYYLNPDVVFLARDLLGKSLITSIDGQGVTGGMIVETEAYAGEIDRASHAYGGRRTQRTETMYNTGGIAYIYLCYGMHHLFNVVTNIEGIPHAILIRGLMPTVGQELMAHRTGKPTEKLQLLNGPGKLTKALGITTRHDKTSLGSDLIWIEDSNPGQTKGHIIAAPRIGVDYAGEHAHWPYRFLMKSLPESEQLPLSKT
ncbi:MAG: DNA-3-methyladenine glycosylase [Bacteroidales bacterium]|jgi:DNA-3-methyladenine glycosylase|nr:DNA-3-methyladenine glycosylase [Bacteroidales bacterium]NLM91558.1 DNA-3-methyladenine glycosylase [Bacteroidales bacterium]